jgi:predicted O-methyltransferase YrrM
MDFFYKLERFSDKYTVEQKKEQKISQYIIDTFNKFNTIKTQLKNTTDSNIKYTYTKTFNIHTNNQYYIWTLLDFDYNNSYNILSKKLDSDFYINKVIDNGVKYIGPVEEIKDKFKNILYNMVSPDLYNILKDLDGCQREEKLYKNRIKTLLYLFDFLEINGNFYLAVQGFCNIQILNIYYALSFMFDNVIIYNSSFVVCKNFNPVIKKSDVELLLEDHYTINPKYNFESLLSYFITNINFNIKKYTILLEGKENKFLSILMEELKTTFKYYTPQLLKDFLLDYNFAMIDNFKSIMLNETLTKISSAVNSKEGLFIKNIIKTNNFIKCLEIGMANGISAFYILSNLKTKLISVDPYQETQWNNNGIKLLKEFKFINRHKLYEKKNFIALPQILQKKKNNYFDFIFIDGFHTFDYTLLDFYYANLLLKINGIIIIDDALHSGVNKCIKYIETNYLFYKKQESPITIAVFKKITEDNRDFNFYKNF